jgi:tetratricopeptide (TPR) repeat protein
MKQPLICLLLLLFCTGLLYGAEDPLHRQQVREGLNAIYDLDYAGAQRIFDQIKKEYPESPVGYGLTAHTAWHKLLFSSRNLAVFEYGIPTPFGRAPVSSESITPEGQAFLDANKELQDICDKLLKENPQNALALYFKGMSYENLSTQALTINRKYLLSTRYAKTAAKFHREALGLDPSLIDAKTSTAVPEYIVGSFNFTLRWLALLLGIGGDKKGAIEKLEEVADKGIYRATDAKVVLALLENWKGDRKHAISLFSSVRKMHPRSFLYDISLAAAYEEAANDPKSAIQIYQELLRDLPSKAPGVQPAEIHFRIGKDYVKLRDFGAALEHFRKALDSPQSDSETKPLTYYQMALVYEERGDKAQARDCYLRVADYSGPTALIGKEISQARKKAR